MRIVIWMNMLAIHQSAHVRALASSGHDVTFVASESLSPDRIAMGWSVPDFGCARVVTSPDDAQVHELISQGSGDAVHIIGGARWHPLGDMAMRECARSGARMGLMSECADSRGWRGLARLAKWRAERIGRGRRLDFILAMGRLGVEWFRQCGYRAEMVYPYAYLTEGLGSCGDSKRSGSTVSLIYVGQCIDRKGMDTAIGALGYLSHLDWTLKIVGEGPSQVSWMGIVSQAGLDNRVTFEPYVPFPEVASRMSASDVLLLPSLFDGWGAVVNEALMQGVPVICSDKCGAADLLKEGWRGSVFCAGHVDGCARALEEWISSGKRTHQLTERIRNWSRCIEGGSAAEYLIGVLKHVYEGGPRPVPPWYG